MSSLLRWQSISLWYLDDEHTSPEFVALRFERLLFERTSSVEPVLESVIQTLPAPAASDKSDHRKVNARLEHNANAERGTLRWLHPERYPALNLILILVQQVDHNICGERAPGISVREPSNLRIRLRSFRDTAKKETATVLETLISVLPRWLSLLPFPCQHPTCALVGECDIERCQKKSFCLWNDLSSQGDLKGGLTLAPKNKPRKRPATSNQDCERFCEVFPRL